MNTFLLILLCIASATVGVLFFLRQRTEGALTLERVRATAEAARLGAESARVTENAQALINQKTEELEAETRRIRGHYETESRKIIEEVHADLGAGA